MAPAGAHPLGNFTVNHLSRLTVAGGAVTVRYVLDMAEIPTVALDRSLDSRGMPSAAAYAAWARAHAADVAPQLELRADGTPLALVPSAVAVRTRPGAAGLRTLYFSAEYRAALPAGTRGIIYFDRSEAGRLGWKDVVLAPATEPTHELRVYPSALTGSPRARVSLAATIDSAGRARLAPEPDATQATGSPPSFARMNALSDLLAQRGGGPLVLLGALLLAVGLGALHALEPGHGKTLLAVSLVGARATAAQALILASSLTVAHTVGVLVLGAIVLFATRWIVPETVYPWITLGSGLLVAVLGARALAAEVRRRRPILHAHVHVHDHAHPHAHDHVHGLGVDEHDHALLGEEAHARAHAVPGTAPLTFRTAVMAAASGNLAPCPAALVVLLAAISLHRIALGMTLIVAFSIGLAATLTILGIAVVRGAAWLSGRPQFAAVSRWAPFASAGAIALVGAAMVGEGLVAQGVPAPVPALAGLTFLAIIGYAFAPSHRHFPTRTQNA
jgi:ABC-type nickel/cobalt efflux system permease component RcnA